MIGKLIVMSFSLAATSLAAVDVQEQWHGFERSQCTVGGHAGFVTRPAIAAPGKPWVWRTSFPDYHADVDLYLLKRGWHVAYVDCVDMLGCDAALGVLDMFYSRVRKDFGLAARPALEAVSRGGLPAYRYAARHPDRIACIYADSPVMDLKSWPLSWPGAKKETGDALACYGFADEAALRAYRGNPVDETILGPIAKSRIPLRHVISLNDRVVPPERNTLEARRCLEKAGHVIDVVAVNEGTAKSNGHHFDLPAAFESARFIMRHGTVLPAEREYFSTRDGLDNSRVKFESSKTGRVVFLGGSITFNRGWRQSVTGYLKQRFPDTRFDFIAAGIPSLGSVPHAFRLERDVLSHGPVDLVFVEAAVNDHNHDGAENHAELALRGMEGVVRHLRMTSPLTDVVELHFIHNQHLATRAEGGVPYTVVAHERVAARYGCPSLDLSREVCDRIKAGEFTWKEDFRDIHPSPYGQQVYANSITRMLDAAWKGPAGKAKAHVLPDPLDSFCYSRGRLGDIHSAKLIKGCSLDPRWKPADKLETRGGFVDVPALVAATPGAEFEFAFDGTAAGLLITSGPDSGVIEFNVDGGGWRRVETQTQWSRVVHLPKAVMLADSLRAGRHVVRVRLTDERPGSVLCVMHLLEN